LVCCFVPDEGFWILVVVSDEASDGVFEFLGGAMDAAPQLLVGEGREPAFDQVESRGGSRREVEVEAWPLGQASCGSSGFYGCRSCRGSGERPTSNSADTFFSMVSRKLRNSVERCRCWVWPMTLPVLVSSAANRLVVSVAGVVVRAALDLTGAHGQQRRGAIQRLDLALLVHAQHQSSIRGGRGRGRRCREPSR
jgi:hypothetical protein